MSDKDGQFFFGSQGGSGYWELYHIDAAYMSMNRTMVADWKGKIWVTKLKDDIPTRSDALATADICEYLDVKLEMYKGFWAGRPRVVAANGSWLVIGQKEKDKKIGFAIIGYRELPNEEGQMQVQGFFDVPGNGVDHLIGDFNGATVYGKYLYLCSSTYLWAYEIDDNGMYVFRKELELRSEMKTPLDLKTVILKEEPVLVIGGISKSENKYVLQFISTTDYREVGFLHESAVNEVKGLRITVQPNSELSRRADAFVVTYSAKHWNSGCWRLENFDKNGDESMYKQNGIVRMNFPGTDPGTSSVISYPIFKERDDGCQIGYIVTLAPGTDKTRRATCDSQWLSLEDTKEIPMSSPGYVNQYGSPMGIVYGPPPLYLTDEQQKQYDQGELSVTDCIYFNQASKDGQKTGWSSSFGISFGMSLSYKSIKIFEMKVGYGWDKSRSTTVTEYTEITNALYAGKKTSTKMGAILANEPGRLVVQSYRVDKYNGKEYEDKLTVKSAFPVENQTVAPEMLYFSLSDPEHSSFDLTGMKPAFNTSDIEGWTQLAPFLTEEPTNGKGEKLESYFQLASKTVFASNQNITMTKGKESVYVKSSSEGMVANVGLCGLGLDDSSNWVTDNTYTEGSNWSVEYETLDTEPDDIYYITMMFLDANVVRQAGRECFWISDYLAENGFSPWCIIYLVEKKADAIKAGRANLAIQ